MASDKLYGPAQETAREIWARLCRGPGQERRRRWNERKQARIDELRASGVPRGLAAEQATEEMANDDEFRKQDTDPLPPPPDPKVEQLAAKDALIRRAGKKGTVTENLEWVNNNVASARGLPGEIRWNLIVEDPPSRGAIDLMELAIVQQDKFHQMYAKQNVAGEDDASVAGERRSIEECRKLLKETLAEIEDA